MYVGKFKMFQARRWIAEDGMRRRAMRAAAHSSVIKSMDDPPGPPS